MTTSIKISAHCDKDTHVIVELDGDKFTVLEDGEVTTINVWAHHKVSVYEKAKNDPL